MIPGLKLMKIVHRLGGVDTPTSWPSTDLQSDQSMSPTSCATVSDADSETNYTIGVTENTPYACRFCDKAFPRQYNLKNHEQVVRCLCPEKELLTNKRRQEACRLNVQRSLIFVSWDASSRIGAIFFYCTP
ncbi:c2H2-type domain-containing protein [Caerostris extrusa]|uniref:C2H2-type domain-containing protein n=1 Tax=Caerostris extrusa TaxID=172846 RepID=A0AAV4QMX4_CAEEX|nr:c2H2-type domain-containing protein [Caerostris extrusa]